MTRKRKKEIVWRFPCPRCGYPVRRVGTSSTYCFYCPACGLSFVGDIPPVGTSDTLDHFGKTYKGQLNKRDMEVEFPFPISLAGLYFPERDPEETKMYRVSIYGDPDDPIIEIVGREVMWESRGYTKEDAKTFAIELMAAFLGTV